MLANGSARGKERGGVSQRQRGKERGLEVSAFANALHGDPLNDCMKNVAAFHGRPHKAAIRQCQLASGIGEGGGGGVKGVRGRQRGKWSDDSVAGVAGVELGSSKCC